MVDDQNSSSLFLSLWCADLGLSPVRVTKDVEVITPTLIWSWSDILAKFANVSLGRMTRCHNICWHNWFFLSVDCANDPIYAKSNILSKFNIPGQWWRVSSELLMWQVTWGEKMVVITHIQGTVIYIPPNLITALAMVVGESGVTSEHR
jgi:hypothetical protein